jgi:4-hydroxybenzoate polyprenyltransferase
MNQTRQSGMSLVDVIQVMRPNHWTKNGLVLAAFFFALWDKSQHIQLANGWTKAIPATLLFCLVSSAVYVMNDIGDVDADRQHPLKRFRAIASGRISIPAAWGLFVLLLAIGLGGAWLLSPAFFKIIAIYAGLQIMYTFFIKHIALVDVFIIAAGFVLRAIAGAVALTVDISAWLLLCTFLLAMFLGLCKRRHEKIQMETTGQESRQSLDNYNEKLLDQLIGIMAAASIIAYALYTLSPETIQKFGTRKLGFTIPFVVFGLFRYLDLVYRHEKGDRPEKILLTDKPTLINIAIYALVVVLLML